MKYYKIETSRGIVKIPKNLHLFKLNKQGKSTEEYIHPSLKIINEDLYSLSAIKLSDCKKFIILELQDPYYGNPEYKILEDNPASPLDSKDLEHLEYVLKKHASKTVNFKFTREAKILSKLQSDQTTANEQPDINDGDEDIRI